MVIIVMAWSDAISYTLTYVTLVSNPKTGTIRSAIVQAAG